MSPRVMRSLLACKVGASAVILCLVCYRIFRAWESGKLEAAWSAFTKMLGHFRASIRSLAVGLRDFLVTALGGYNPTQVNWLLYRAALLSQQASSGKYSSGMKPVVTGQIHYVQQAICALDKTYAEP